MKKLSVSIAFIFCFFTAHSQEHQIERLEQQLKDHPQADTIRVNRLNKLGEMFSLSTGKRDTLSAEASAISQKLSYYNGEAFALCNQAVALTQAGHRDKAFLSLKRARALLGKINNDELWVRYWFAMGQAITQVDNQKAIFYLLKADSLAEKLPDKELTARLQRTIAGMYNTSLTNYPKAMEWVLKSIKTAEEANSLDGLALSWSNLASYYIAMGDNKNGLFYYKKALDANKTLDDRSLSNRIYNNIGERYRLMGNYPEAIKAYKQQLVLSGLTPYFIELCESNMADVYVRTGELPMAFKYAFHSLKLAGQIEDTEGIAWIDGILSRAYSKANKPDSAVYYGNKGIEAAKKTGTIEFMRDNYGALANAYAQKKNFVNAYRYQGLYVAYRDSMLNSEIANKASLLQYNYGLAKKQAQIVTLNQQKKLQNILQLGTLAVLLLIGITVVVLYHNNRQKQKANNQLSKALGDLKATQTQLIQSEKMASLGELTAGIAHEIQNPLNFVNNFSEVNKDLLTEMKEEMDNGNLVEAKAIANDVIENETKINHHGKRADAIVKGMLQHSQSGSGTKELTNLNALADECMRLSYHGLRAKDKSFNAELVTNFDDNLPKVNVIPQDMGRVLLNLFNNAFYAVNQKAKSAGNEYRPQVSVTTELYAPPLGGRGVVVKVLDNGIGIPDAIKDKIMQPFFTTKPTGDGTGLGLSLTYDMVVKGHGGSIQIESTEGLGSEFIINLPLNSQ